MAVDIGFELPDELRTKFELSVKSEVKTNVDDLAPKSKTVLYKMLIAIAKAKFGYKGPFHDDSASRLISEAADVTGYPVPEQTVRNCLNRAWDELARLDHHPEALDNTKSNHSK